LLAECFAKTPAELRSRAGGARSITPPILISSVALAAAAAASGAISAVGGDRVEI